LRGKEKGFESTGMSEFEKNHDDDDQDRGQNEKALIENEKGGKKENRGGVQQTHPRLRTETHAHFLLRGCDTHSVDTLLIDLVQLQRSGREGRSGGLGVDGGHCRVGCFFSVRCFFLQREDGW
jgi:hypothetical protein